MAVSPGTGPAASAGLGGRKWPADILVSPASLGVGIGPKDLFSLLRSLDLLDIGNTKRYGSIGTSVKWAPGVTNCHA